MTIAHEWVPIQVGDRTVLMSRDAFKRDGVRINLTYDQAKALAAEIGGRLPTPEELDARFKRADLKNRPHTQRLWLAAGGTPASRPNDNGELHSKLIDDDVGNREGCIVGNCGKHWVNTPDGAPSRWLYGWHVPASEVAFRNGRYWGYGLPVHRSESEYTDAYVVQRSTDSSHGGNHVDYSMTGVFSRDPGFTDGDDIYEPGGIVIEGQVPPASDTEPSPISHSTSWQLWDDEEGDVQGDLIAFRQARHYRKGRKAALIWLMVHTAELLEDLKGQDTNAEALMNYAATMPDGRKASWHFSVDSDTVCQSVDVNDTAWHAGGGGVNDQSIGVEHSGYAAQNDREWADDYSTAMLTLSAELFAILCRKHNIPPRKVTPTEMRAGVPGICGHVDAAVAFRKTTHRDPGPNFPWDRWIHQVQEFYRALAPWFDRS